MPQHTIETAKRIDELLTVWQQRNNNGTRFIHTDFIDQVTILSLHLIIKQLCADYDLHIIGDSKEERERAHSIHTAIADYLSCISFIQRHTVPEKIALLYFKISATYRQSVHVLNSVVVDIVDYLLRLQHDDNEYTSNIEFGKSFKDLAIINDYQSSTTHDIEQGLNHDHTP
jgi:hypothetical protein